jgi:UDP-N-acetylglucosamine 4-epimerase
MNEVYAQVFARTYPIQTVGLRYFNVFGPRQDPDGPYAAVIPRWVKALMHGQVCDINGDGSTSRDFCFVANVVQANVRAALAPMEASGRVYNVAVGGKTSLLSLYGLIRERVAVVKPDVADLAPQFRPFRAGDIKDSRADISLAINDLGYVPTHTVEQGLDETLHPLRLRAWE